MGRYRRYSEDAEEETSHKFKWFGNNRMLCDVLEDMRKCASTHNYSLLPGLIEEAQIMGNRMESALSDQKDLISLNIELSKARKAYKKLEREFRELEAKVKSKRPKQKAKTA